MLPNSLTTLGEALLQQQETLSDRVGSRVTWVNCTTSMQSMRPAPTIGFGPCKLYTRILWMCATRTINVSRPSIHRGDPNRSSTWHLHSMHRFREKAGRLHYLTSFIRQVGRLMGRYALNHSAT